MLNLIYYDIKATYKRILLTVMLLSLLAFAVRFLWSDVFMSVFDNKNFYIGNIIQFAAAALLGVCCFIAFVVIIYGQCSWFDENILSAQGQLTNMLPVSSYQIVFSKILVAFVWNVIILLTFVGVSCVFFMESDILELLVSAVNEFAKLNNVHISIVSMSVSICLCIALAMTGFISLCFLSQMVGQIFNLTRNLMIFISFFAFAVVSISLHILVLRLLGIADPLTALVGKTAPYVVSYIFSVVTKLTVLNFLSSLACWLGASAILKNKLNML